MRSLADAACELPWLAPSAGSLIALTRSPSGSLWSSLRDDPGLVLLLLRCHGPRSAVSGHSLFYAALRDASVLELALDCLGTAEPVFVDWHEPRFLPTYRSVLACARTAEAIARKTDRCDADHAWVGGLLAPLGWLAYLHEIRNTSADIRCPKQESLPDCGYRTKENGLFPEGFDGPAIARRLAARWGLPAWLGAVVGYLGLPVDAASGLGADPDHFLVVQLAVAIVEKSGLGLGLGVGAPLEKLARSLELTPAALQILLSGVQESANPVLPAADWKSPGKIPLLADLLRLAIQVRQTAHTTERDRLHVELDALHDAFREHRASEEQRVQQLKLRGLAELAAGAGHEINNPLAVISGQAQYLLLSDQDPARRKALQTIVGQAQRIHQTLTQMMQFARPPLPQKQHVDLGGLLSEVAGSMQALADERQIRLSVSEPPAAMTLLVDPGQIRTAIAALLRNAVEAAPASGWASLCVCREPGEAVTVTVEDSGTGLSAADREHLFDPFYSGRRAGRGCGLGLPTAWQFARQHGGDVRFEPTENGPTRFVLTLPGEVVVDALPLMHPVNSIDLCRTVTQSA